MRGPDLLYQPQRESPAVTRGRIDVSDVWVQDATSTSRFTFDPADDRISIWSPDGARVVFASNREGHFLLYQKSTIGAGADGSSEALSVLEYAI